MEKQVAPITKKSQCFTEQDVREFLDSILEMWTDEELNDNRVIMKELRYFMGLPDKTLKALISGARDIRKLRGRRLPEWALPFQNH